jgi:hypothetical protein
MSEAEKYEEWAEQLKAQLASHKKLRRQVRYFPVFAIVTSAIAFVWSHTAAFVICLAWFCLWATTLYITAMRTWQHKIELTDTYSEIERLRGTPKEPTAAS